MDSTRLAGLVTTALALVGYALGVLAPYPGRALTLTGMMVGLTLAAVGGGGGGDGDGGGNGNGSGSGSGADDGSPVGGRVGEGTRRGDGR